MKNSNKPALTKTDPAINEYYPRGAFWAAVIILAADIAYIFIILFYVMRANASLNSQVFTMLAAGFVVGLLVIGAMFAVRSNHLPAAGGMMLTSIFLWALIVSSCVKGVGIMAGLAVLFSTLSISTQTFPKRSITISILSGVFVGVISSMLEFYPLFQQIEVPGGQRLPYVAIALVVLFLILTYAQFRNYALSSKFIVFFLIVTLVVGSTVAALTLILSRVTVSNSVGTHIQDLATSQAFTIGETISRQIDSLVILANNQLLQTALMEANQAYPGNPGQIQDLLDGLDNQWRAADAENNNDDPLVKSHLENPVASELLKYTVAFPNNVEVFITDIYGGLVGSSQRTSDYYQADEEWWQSAYANGDGAIYISQPEFDESANQMSVLISLPVYDPQMQAMVGILRTTYAVSEFPVILASTRVGSTGSADLIFADNTILQEGNLGELDPGDQKIFDQAKGSVFIQGIWANNPSLVSAAPVSSLTNQTVISDLGWNVVFHQNSEEALKSVDNQNRTSLIITILNVGLISIIAVGLAQILSKPITRLTSVAEKVGAGNFAMRASVDSKDEIGTLASTFNQMTDRLQETLQGLERRVEKRTQELVLAGQAGNELSRLRDLEMLLERSVELINTNFNLYYTQVYLVDPSRRYLVLRAGTGDVGQTLLNQEHNLPINSNSINGSAAVEKNPVIVVDTDISATFKPNPLLPETRSEIAVPLMVGDRVVGVLDMQSRTPGSLSTENLPAFEALAGQLAVAIENAELIQQVEKAREEVERNARKLTREGWGNYLNAIDREERLGYSSVRNEIAPLTEPLMYADDEATLSVPMKITGEEIGLIKLEKPEGERWNLEDTNLVNSIAEQVSRQIENLRLLAQAEQYQREAEDAVRRLLREGWTDYLSHRSTSQLDFIYDQNLVLDFDKAEVFENPAIKLPLVLRNEAIGEVALEGIDLTNEETLDLIRTINQRLAAHIENLRLSERTERALSETEALYSITSELNAAQTFEEILKALTDRTILQQADRLTLLSVYDRPMDGNSSPEWVIPVASHTNIPVEIASKYPVEVFEPSPHALFSDKPLMIEDIEFDNRLDRSSRTLFYEIFQAKSSLIVPLMLGDRSIGFVQGFFETKTKFNENDVDQLALVANQAAIAVQSRILYEQAQNRARYEQLIREVTAQVYGAADTDSIMRTTVEQVGRVLGQKAFVYLERKMQGNQPDPEDGNGHLS